MDGLRESTTPRDETSERKDDGRGHARRRVPPNGLSPFLLDGRHRHDLGLVAYDLFDEALGVCAADEPLVSS